MPDEKLYNVEEAMNYLRISSRSTIYQLVNSGALVGHNLGGAGGSLRFRKEDLDKALVPTGPVGGRPNREQLATRGVSRGIGGFVKHG